MRLWIDRLYIGFLKGSINLTDTIKTDADKIAIPFKTGFVIHVLGFNPFAGGTFLTVLNQTLLLFNNGENFVFISIELIAGIKAGLADAKSHGGMKPYVFKEKTGLLIGIL